MKLRPSENNPVPIPPWGAKATWQEANCSVEKAIQRYVVKLRPALTLASLVRRKLESIFDILNDLCMETCPHCPDPCCLNASPWFDFRDLIFLHLNDLAVPISQPIEFWNTPCRFYSSQGCRSARISRPWICTWYLCPVQTANLKNRQYQKWQYLISMLCAIKTLRKEMEDAVIREII